MAEAYNNIRYILDSIMQHPLLQNLTLEKAVSYTIEFMRIVGVPSIFENKTVILEIDDYRAALPDDYYQMIQVRSTKENIPFRYSTDNFHLSHNNTNPTEYSGLTYKIQGGIIYTSIKEGEIEISYEAIMVDDDGFPLLPDNSSFTRALELYIKKKCFTVLFDLGKIQLAVLQNVQREYAWAVGDCQTEFNRLSIDKAESFYNSWRTLIIRGNEHRTGFKSNGELERLKLQ